MGKRSTRERKLASCASNGKSLFSPDKLPNASLGEDHAPDASPSVYRSRSEHRCRQFPCFPYQIHRIPDPYPRDALFKVQSDVIRRLAAEKSCVFVGRCADYILREHPRCANVFISASKEDRIIRLCRIHNVNEEVAEEMIEKADKRRSEYYNYYSYKTWGAAATYHLCIDSSSLGIEETVRFVEEFVAKKLQLRF